MKNVVHAGKSKSYYLQFCSFNLCRIGLGGKLLSLFHPCLSPVTFKKDRAMSELLKLERIFPHYKTCDFSEVMIILISDAFMKLSWAYSVSFKAIDFS